MIREATEEDLPVLVRMGREFHAATIEDSAFIAADFEASMIGYLAQGEWAVLIDNKQRGFLVGVIFADYWNSSVCRAHELMWWVSPKSRSGMVGPSLMKAFTSWARKCGAQTLSIAQRTNMKSNEKTYRRMGLAPCETVYVGTL